MKRYEETTDEGSLILDTFQGSVDLFNDSGKITLSWDEVHKLKDLLPKAINDAIGRYFPPSFFPVEESYPPTGK